MNKKLFRRVYVIALVLMLLPVLVFSAEEKATAKVKKGAEVTIVSGSMVNWKDIPKIRLDQTNLPRKMRAILNFENPKKIKVTSPQADPVVQTEFTDGKMERTANAITSGTNFAGMYYSANGAGWPPDTCGDVGGNYFVQAVNTSIGIYNKSTGALVSATTFDSFFPSSVGAPCDADNNGDPIVLYDRYNQRWFILDFAWYSSETQGSHYSIAASQTSDPTGSWYTYCLQADTTLMNDYPKAGVWHDGIYITANMFQFTGSFQHVKVWAIRTPQVYQGTLTSQSVTDSSYYAFSLMPANAKSPTGPSSTAPCYIYAMDADEWGSPSTDALYVWKYDIDWTNSANTTWTGPTLISGVAAFTLSSSGVPQSGTSNTLDSLYGRLMNPAYYWNYGTYESIFLCHVCDYSSRRAMRWYEIRISSGTSSIYQQGTYSPDATHRWMGSVIGDKNGNIGMGYSASSSTIYPGIRYCGRTSSDSLGTMGQGEATMVNGGGYQSSYTRWGDYSNITIDPADDETFWYTQEYYTSSGTNWQTRIGSFTIGGSVPPVNEIAEAVDNTNYTYTLSGDANWAKVTDVYYYGSDSAKSGTITHSQSTSFETSVTVTSAQAVKFYWKVSSEASYDYLTFYIDGVQQDRIAGTVDWTQKSFNIATGTHTLKWTYSKDSSVSSGSDCGWVDKLEVVAATTDPLAEAVDYPGLTFTLSGTGSWYSQTTTTYYGGDAAQSPVITHSQSSSMQTTISGKTSVKFYWRVSSESGYDYLRFYIDGVLKNSISGSTSWAQKSYTVTTGTHTLKWTYSKDGSVSSGSDCGWVDKLE